jgi:hypothetical protein
MVDANNRFLKLFGACILALLLSSCSAVDAITGVTLDVSRIESEIENGVLDQAGYSVTATCPDPMSGQVGDTRTCSIEDENGTVALVDVTIQNTNGDIVWKVQR